MTGDEAREAGIRHAYVLQTDGLKVSVQPAQTTPADDRTEVSSRDGPTHVRSYKTRLADDKLTRESFQDELEGMHIGSSMKESATDYAPAIVVSYGGASSTEVIGRGRRYRRLLNTAAAQEKSA